MKILKQINIIALLLQFILMMSFILIWEKAGSDNAFVFGVLTYFVLSYLLRTLIPRTHRLGIAFIKHGELAAAIDCFEASYGFFTKYSVIDKLRFITLLTASKVSYREMALLNIAFCYSRLGEQETAKKYYQKIITVFPGNELAVDQLKNFDAEKELALQSALNT